MYRLFYDYETNGDVLFLLIDPEAKVDHTKQVGNVTVLYDVEDKILGANLFTVSSVVKIHSKGALFAPSEKLLSAINPWLEAAGVPALAPEKSSGFKVFEITKLEEHPLEAHSSIVTLSDGKKDLTSVSSLPDLKVGDVVVGATDGCILSDGSVFHAGEVRHIQVDTKLMSAKELRLSDEEGAFHPEGYALGDDFFLSEGKR